MKNFEKELKEIETFVKCFKGDDTIKVSIKEQILYVHGTYSYKPKYGVGMITDENTVILAYGNFPSNDGTFMIKEKEIVGRLKTVGLDMYPINKTVNSIMRSFA